MAAAPERAEPQPVAGEAGTRIQAAYGALAA